MALEVRIRIKNRQGMLDVQFRQAGGTMALLGEKDGTMSRVLRCIAGIETPDEGRIVFDDTVLYDSLAGINLPPAARRVGYLFPGGALFPTMTVEANIRMALLGGGRDLVVTPESKHAQPAIIDTKVSEFLRDYHLDGLGGSYPGELSPVQQRQAAFARMMAGNPRLVLLDDPFAALDDYRKADVVREIRQLLQTRSLPAVLASTDLDEVYAMGDSVTAIRGGKSEPMQMKADFYEHPETLQAALLGGCRNIGDVRLLDPCHALVPAWGTLFSFRDAQGTLQRLPAGLKAMAIKPRDFLTEPPRDAQGHRLPCYKFSIYRPRIEEERNDYSLIFSPNRREGGGELVYTVPKTADARTALMGIRRLYVAEGNILRLR